MPCLLAYLRESLDFFKVGIFGVMSNIWNRAAEEELILQKLKTGCKVLKYLTKKDYDIRCKNY